MRRLDMIEGSPAIYTSTIDYFRGVDMTDAPINVAVGRAFNAPNMIRDVPGKVRKRMGYEIVRTYEGRINGLHEFDGHMIVHAGIHLYSGTDVITDGNGIQTQLPNERSTAYRLGNKLMILTGREMFAYWEDDGVPHVASAKSMATVPQVTVGRHPDGTGGDSLGQINMLTPKYTDSFLSDADAVNFQLSFYPVDGDVTAEKIDDKGEWHDITSTIASIDRATGVVKFKTAPGAPPVSGEDNVRIHAASESINGADKVDKCRFGIVSGMNGAYDRLFISGNPDLPNTDFFSNSGDPLYFGDWNYGEIGKEGSPITGYSIVEGQLATHKKADDNDRNCYLRTGEVKWDTDLENNNDIVDLMTVKFPITGIIQGKGCIAPYSMGYVTEPLYLTSEGVYATTPYEYNARLYAQRRSFYLDGALLKEEALEDAVACVYKDFYLLALNGNVYILDILQRDSSNVTRGSMYQYEGYFWTGIPVRVWYTDDRLWFGDEQGNLCRFFDDKYNSGSYADNGVAYQARWDFMHTGTSFHLDKTLMWFAINMDSTPNASIELYARKSTDPNYSRLVIEGNVSFFSYESLIYSKWVYGGGDQPKTIGKKVRVKRYDSCILSLRNDELHEGIFLYAITLQFAEGEKYKL